MSEPGGFESAVTGAREISVERRERRYIWNVDVAYLDNRDSRAVVEIGCAEGYLAVKLAEYGFVVTGVEPEAYLRAKFEHEAERHGVSERCTVISADVHDLPFASGSVPALIMTEVLEHVKEPDRAVKEIARVLRPGGRVCLSVPTKMTEVIFGTFHPRYTANATHLRQFSRSDIRRLAQTNGLQLHRTEGRNFRHSLEWLAHSILRSDADHAGRLREHLWVERISDRGWLVLQRMRVARTVDALGNRMFPKSWYFYLEKPSD